MTFNPVRVERYDDNKGYIGDERLERVVLNNAPYLVDDSFYHTGSGKIYRVLHDDGKKDEILAVEIKNKNLKNILVGVHEKNFKAWKLKARLEYLSKDRYS